MAADPLPNLVEPRVGETATLDGVDRSAVEFLDLGCGTGNRLVYAARRFGVPGIGVDRNPQKVARAQRVGLPAYHADILDLDPAAFPAVKYVTLDNVLEHLPSLDAVEEIVHRACRLAQRMVHIRHPSFEDEDYLASLGLKQYWTDWPGHTAHVRIHELVAMAARAGVHRVEVRPIIRSYDSNDASLLPSTAPRGQDRSDRAKHGAVYDAVRHGPKQRVEFDRPVYHAFDLFLFLQPRTPLVHYPRDSESCPERPLIVWPDEPVVHRLRRTIRAKGARFVRRLSRLRSPRWLHRP